MKLKKIASLALAGVMALSMLAGCANNNNNGSSSEVPVATGMTGKVIAALDVDNVTFGTDSSLQNTLNMVAENTAKTGFSGISGSNLVTLNPNLGDATNKLAVINTNADDSNDADGKKDTYVFTVYATGTNEDMVAIQLADKIEKAQVYNTNTVMADMPEKSNPDSNNKYHYSFDYTASVAVVSATDASTGNTTYVAAVVLTRTADKVEYSKV